MASTLTSLDFHLIFSTKHREPLIGTEWRSAFSVSASSCDAVRSYIARQEEHHRRKSSRDEMLEFLAKCGVAFDPQYLE